MAGLQEEISMLSNTLLKATPKLAFWAAIVVVLAIAYLSLMPSEELPSPRLNDKLNHVIAYGVLAVLATIGRKSVAIIPVLGGVIVYGFLIEGLQGVMGLGRSASWLDGLANTVGALAGVGLGLWLGRWLGSRNG